MKNILLVLAAVATIACSPRIRTNITRSHAPLDYREELIVVSRTAIIPQDVVEVGTIAIGDSGFSTSCDWDRVIEEASMEARKAGGNVLKIIQHSPPDIISTCHRIRAQILKVDDRSIFDNLKQYRILQ